MLQNGWSRSVPRNWYLVKASVVGEQNYAAPNHDTDQQGKSSPFKNLFAMLLMMQSGRLPPTRRLFARIFALAPAAFVQSTS